MHHHRRYDVMCNGSIVFVCVVNTKAKLARSFVPQFRILTSAKCPFGKTSVRHNVRRLNIRSAKCLSVKCLSAKCLSAKCLTAKCPGTNIIWLYELTSASAIRYKKLQLAEKIGIKTFYDLHNYWTSISVILD